MCDRLVFGVWPISKSERTGCGSRVLLSVVTVLVVGGRRCHCVNLCWPWFEYGLSLDVVGNGHCETGRIEPFELTRLLIMRLLVCVCTSGKCC